MTNLRQSMALSGEYNQWKSIGKLEKAVFYEEL